MNWLEVPGRPKLLKSECEVFTILRDDRFEPPLFSATKWLPSKNWDRPSTPKQTLGRFDSLEAAQQACEAVA